MWKSILAAFLLVALAAGQEVQKKKIGVIAIETEDSTPPDATRSDPETFDLRDGIEIAIWLVFGACISVFVMRYAVKRLR
jgi:hypothetical protein